MKILRKIKNIIETNKNVQKICDSLAKTFVYKSYIKHRINQYIRYIKKTKKYNVIIETSNFCNANCIMCPHSILKRPKSIMSNKTFALIIEKLKKENITPLAFILNGFGEPFTDKKIISRIKTIRKEFKKSKIKIYSNLSIPNKKMLLSLINSGLDEINVSFNGYDKKSYENTMKINYTNPYNNLKTFLKLNKKDHKIVIRISSTLVKTNDTKIKEFVKKWGKIVDSVSINKIHNYNNSIKNQAKEYKINFKKTNVFPCKYIFNSIVIGVAGDIFLCCLDYEGKYKFGNIYKNKILDIFYSKKFENIRLVHLNKKISQIPICKNCYTPYKNGTEWLIKKLY